MKPIYHLGAISLASYLTQSHTLTTLTPIPHIQNMTPTLLIRRLIALATGIPLGIKVGNKISDELFPKHDKQNRKVIKSSLETNVARLILLQRLEDGAVDVGGRKST